ncbi:MAG: PEP-CTERM sorting domain-containing protein [Planctomycetaceae bacterium]
MTLKQYGLIAIVLCVTIPVQAGVIFSDDFDNIDASQWSLTSDVGARGAGIQGFDTGNALHFAGYGIRSATTIDLNTTNGETITFDFRGGNEDVDGSLYWEDVDNGEDAVLEYSIDGVNFTRIDRLDLVQFRNDSPTTTWLTYTGQIPDAAKTAATRFRWRQLRHSGWRWDEWAIDNVSITATPEPSTWMLIGVAAAASVCVRRRRMPGIVGSSDD